MPRIDYFQNADDFESFAAGQVILREGEPGDRMYVVIRGEVEVVLQDRVIETVGPNNIVGEMALIDATTRSAAVVAKTDCRLVPIDRKRFIFLVRQTPYFALQVMQVLTDRLRRMTPREDSAEIFV